MKKLLVIFAFLFAVYSCKGQELYIVKPNYENWKEFLEKVEVVRAKI